MRNRKIMIQSAIFGVFTIGFICLSFALRKDIAGLFVNIICVLIMGALIAYGLGITPIKKTGIFRMIFATDDIKNATVKINEFAEDPTVDIESELCGENAAELFADIELSKSYLSYRNELNRLYRAQSDFRYVDVADYISTDLLDSLSNTHFNDLVGGMMTGMGILGTFVGLMFGLRNFDPSSAQSMVDTIPPLIDGIKIAFLTSIFGVIFSLIFNVIYRNTTQDAEAALEEFHDAYYKLVSPRPENDGFTKLINYQQSQTESMAQFAEQISLTMAQALDRSVVPTFERIGGTIETLGEKLAATQDQNMERIASELLENLNKLMGDQLSHLGESVQNLSEIQNAAAERMKDTTAQIAQAGGDLGDISVNLRTTVAAMAGYMQSLDEMHSNMRKEYAAILDMYTKVSEDVKKQHDALKEILDMEQKSLGTMHQIQETHEKNLAEEQEASHQFRTDVMAFIGDVQNSVQQSTTDITETLRESAKEQLEQLHISIEAIENSQKQAIESLAGCFEDLRQKMHEMQEMHTKKLAEEQEATQQFRADVMAFFGDIQNSVQQSTTDITETLNESARAQLAQLLISIEAIENSQKQATESYAKYFEDMQRKMDEASITTVGNMDKIMQERVRQIEECMEQINKAQMLFVSEMEKASEKLSNSSNKISDASADLTTNLDKAMSRTYQEIDRQLAEIVRHLSGTIVDIRDITEKVPRMLADSSEQMNETVTSYLTQVNESQQAMLKQITAITQPTEE